MVTKPQRKRISNLLYRNVDDGYTHPATLYCGLVTGSISDDGTITGEVSGGGYARVAVTMNSTTFSAADDSAVCRNLVDISFPESTTSWGNITAVFFTYAQTGGTAQYYIPISPARTVQAYTTVYFKGDPSGVNGNIQLSTSN